MLQPIDQNKPFMNEIMKHLRISSEIGLRRWLEGLPEAFFPAAEGAVQSCVTTPLDMDKALNGLPSTDALSYYHCKKVIR